MFENRELKNFYMDMRYLNFFIIIIILLFSNCRTEEPHSVIVNIDINKMLDFRLTDKMLHKCCPSGGGIVRVSFEASGAYAYGCIDVLTDNQTNIFNTTFKYPLVPLQILLPESHVTYGFPTECDETDVLIEIELASVSYMPDTYCIDKVFAESTNYSNVSGNGSLIMLTCRNSITTGKQKMPSYRSISKCCPENMVFDTENHICLEKSMDTNETESFDLVKSFFQDVDVLDLRHGMKTCLTPNVVMEYVVAERDVEFKENRLKFQISGKRILLEKEDFCIDKTRQETLVVRACKGSCQDGVCVTKCCPDGQVYMFPKKCPVKAQCAVNPDTVFSPTFYHINESKEVDPFIVNSPKNVGIRYTPSCPAGKYMLNPGRNKKDKYYLDYHTGNLVIPYLPQPQQKNYCFETLISSCPSFFKSGFYAFNCFPLNTATQKDTHKLRAFSICLAISAVFLAATLLVYILLPALQNLHGRTLMCQLAAMLVAYSCLSRAQSSTVARHYCKVLGYTIYYSFLAAFSWLNIMCFDIWWTFGNIRAVHGIRQGSRKEIKKFLWFSLYAWGVPLLLTILTYTLDEFPVNREYLDANIGETKCWFGDSYRGPVLILFILPVGIQIMINMVLFIMTVKHCNKVKSEIHRMQAGSMGERCKRRFMADKDKLTMNLKLFVVMGVTWITEVVSTVFNQYNEMWYITDGINLFQGIFIFIILVLKRKVYRLIRKRLGIEEIRGRSETSTTHFSSTVISRNSGSESKNKRVSANLPMVRNGKSQSTKD